MFNTVYIEDQIKDSEQTQKILEKIKYQEIQAIEKYDDIWGRVKKPYLQKRETLNLFIAKKKGGLVKPAPDAYGLGGENHFFFVHAYNCIYECQYCYLQGYFNTPDLVLFINHDEISDEMESLISMSENKNAWFHAGEYSDSLAVSHITGELEVYFDLFKKYPKNKLELRTKSVNIKPLLKLTPTDNIYVSFTLSSKEGAKAFDYKCPTPSHAKFHLKKLIDHGYHIGIHLDPIIYHEGFEQEYTELLNQLGEILSDNRLGYISIGVVRFTKEVHKEVLKNYPDSPMHRQDFIKSFDGKIRYNRSMRMWIMNTVKKLCLDQGYSSEKIYLCMED